MNLNNLNRYIKITESKQEIPNKSISKNLKNENIQIKDIP